MSEQLNKLVVNIPQNFSDTEKQQGRENLGISGEGWLVPDRPTPANDLMLTTDTLGAMQWESKASNEGIKPSQLSSYILAGSNITITPGSSSITISSTGGGQTYSAGAGISIVNNEIAAKTDNSTIMVNVDGELEANIPAQQQSNWTESDNTSPSFILNKPDLSVYMQPSQLSSYIVAGSNMNITTSGSTLTLNATAAPQVQSDWAETDPADASYILNKPTIPAAPVQSNWNESDTTSLAYIQNKPSIPVVPSMKPLVAGSNVSIVEGTNDVTISATAAPQLQANWNETSTSSVQYIQNKPTIPTLPTMKPLVAGSNITITEGVSDVTISASSSSLPALTGNAGKVLTVNSGATDVEWQTNSASLFVAVYGVSTWAEVNAAWTAGRLVFGRLSSAAHGYTAPLTYIDTDGSFMFMAYTNYAAHVSSKQNDEVTLFTLDPQDNWSRVTNPVGTAIQVGNGLSSTYANNTLSIVCSGYGSYNVDWTSPYNHTFVLTQENITNGYFDGILEFATQSDVSGYITSATRISLGWDVWWSGGLATSRISSVDFGIGTHTTSSSDWRALFTDNSPAHEFHKDWTMVPGYILHTRYNRIRMRCNLTSGATVGDTFQIEVTGIVEQLR